MELPKTLEELEALKKQIEQKAALLKECPKQKYKEGLYILLHTNRYSIPPQYLKFLEKYEDGDPDDLMKDLLEDSSLIHFPILMSLLQVWPCSSMSLRERLIQLFDSYILHNDAGLSLANIVDFPTDQILDMCSDHDPIPVVMRLNEQLQRIYRLDVTKHDIENKNNEATVWLNTVMSSLRFIIYVISILQEDRSNIFALSLNFLLRKNVPYDKYSVLTVLHGIPDSTTTITGHYGIFNQLVDEVNSNGSDYMFSKSILPAFKGITFDKGLAI